MINRVQNAIGALIWRLVQPHMDAHQMQQYRCAVESERALDARLNEAFARAISAAPKEISQGPSTLAEGGACANPVWARYGDRLQKRLQTLSASKSTARAQARKRLGFRLVQVVAVAAAIAVALEISRGQGRRVQKGE